MDENGNGGYATVTVGFGSGIAGHRLSWIPTRGPIPAGMNVLHTCDVRKCVAPWHLWLGTQSDNLQDCVAKGRHVSNRATACRNGHPYGPDNTAPPNSNNYRCRICWEACLASKYRSRQRGPRTHCPNDHEYTPDNVLPPNRQRVRCRICYEAAKAAKRKAA